MDVQFVASVSPIVRDKDVARAFYREALGLTFEGGWASPRWADT
jgi:catechol 2,3-dioxygenase-like lactoylglutathione lyase family enzyme